MANTGELMKNMQGIFKAIFPELNGYHFPIRARVVTLHEEGGKVDEYNKRYSVDVQPLAPDGSADESQPIIPDVELPVLWAGQQRGVYCLPVIGAIVRLAYYYNDPAYPFIDAVLADGYDVPAHPANSLIICQSEGIEMTFTPHGKIVFVKGSHPMTFADVVKAVFDGHTHPTPHGESGTPSQKMVGHASEKVFTG